jgi:hypothetical protein
MQVSKTGPQIDITWDVTTCGASLTYNVYAGNLGNFAKVTEAVCGLAPTGSATIQLSGLNMWWLVVGSNGSAIGSFGTDSSGRDRILTGWGPLCVEALQDNSAVCP